MRMTHLARTILPLAAAVVLTGCGGEPEYEADAEDLSGGEFTTRDPDEPAVDVDLPETPMTNASQEEIEAARAEEEAEAEGAAMDAAE
ncbi:hypothetical protein [Aurantiacibacter poecillastricola]|uniref:hypothetical protein n=1 Tax=Aurantiacibacter poecillastricola TaxID=3064385 RepID=UPI00273D0651|nr:hypothetical protein [Aurantiacibacter sp. 219JJ12-13]MDP5260829.1 hypothetical protein [Aurantiacibacter sp. 219JJ12-13]